MVRQEGEGVIVTFRRHPNHPIRNHRYEVPDDAFEIWITYRSRLGADLMQRYWIRDGIAEFAGQFGPGKLPTNLDEADMASKGLYVVNNRSCIDCGTKIHSCS